MDNAQNANAEPHPTMLTSMLGVLKEPGTKDAVNVLSNMNQEAMLTLKITIQMLHMTLDFGKSIKLTGDNAMVEQFHVIQILISLVPRKSMAGEVIAGNCGQPPRDVAVDSVII